MPPKGKAGGGKKPSKGEDGDAGAAAGAKQSKGGTSVKVSYNWHRHDKIMPGVSL